MRVILISNTSKATVNKVDGKYQVKGIPITVNNSKMNRVLYPEDENSKGMHTMNGKPIVLSHPSTESGANVSVFTPEGIDFYSGSKSKMPYVKNNIWYTDTDIDEKKLRAAQNGDYFADRLEQGLPIGVSTGLLFEANNESGDGYDMVARNMEFDHLAMLHESEAPAGGDATVMRFNGEDVKAFCVNELIDSLTTEQEDSFFKRIYNRLMPKVDEHITKRYNEQDTNINVNEHEVPEMELKDLQEALQANNEQLLKTFNEQLDAKVSSLDSKIDAVNSAVTANADKEKAELVTKVNALDLGLPESAISAMNTDVLKGLLAKHEGQPAGGVNTNSQRTEDDKPTARHTFSVKGA